MLSRSSMMIQRVGLFRFVSNNASSAAPASASATKTESAPVKIPNDIVTVTEGALKDVPQKETAVEEYKSEYGYISGQPVKQANRFVTILQPSKNAMQSGTYQTRYWKIEFDVEQRWENPLMGWISSADPLQAIDLHMRFTSKDDAIRFAEKNGWEYRIKETKQSSPSINRKYADNFKHQPKGIRYHITK